MYERIIEIIALVISELKNKRYIYDIDIKELAELGYTQEEISTAFSWLVDRMDFSEKFFTGSQESSPESFRILLDFEREFFTDEALSEIVHLNTLGLLTNEMLEGLIDRITLMGITQIDVIQLRNFIAYYVFQVQPGDFSNRIMLQGNDTIN
jgi:uncharacterized protein Smg (DUF494 family)